MWQQSRLFFYMDQLNIGFKDLELWPYLKFTCWHIISKMLWQKYPFYTSLLPFLHAVNDFRGETHTHTHIQQYLHLTYDLKNAKRTLYYFTLLCGHIQKPAAFVCVWCGDTRARHAFLPLLTTTDSFTEVAGKKKGTLAESKLAMLPSSATQWLFAEFKTGTFGFKWEETQHDGVARLDFKYIKLLVEFCQLKKGIEGL